MKRYACHAAPTPGTLSRADLSPLGRGEKTG
jgi:hypothetical protein